MRKLLNQFRRGQKGFILIELLVVVAVLGHTPRLAKHLLCPSALGDVATDTGEEGAVTGVPRRQ